MQKLLRILAVIMAAMLVVFMVGCGGGEDEEEGEEDGTVQPPATTATTSPAAGSTVPANASLAITLDEAADDVKVNDTAATGSGKNWNINLADLNLSEGPATLTISWTNKDGSDGAGASVALTIDTPDTEAPAIKSGTVSDGDKDVEPAGLNTDGITITFSENVKDGGTISLSIEGGDEINWLPEWSADSVTIVPAKGAELGNETSYEIKVSVEDGAGNKLDATISFTTKAKE